MVRRAEDALFSIVAGLSSPLLSKSGADSQDFSQDSQDFSETHTSFHLVCMNQPLGQARRMPSLVTGRCYRAKVHWRAAELSTVVLVNSLFLRANATCRTNSLCLSHSYFVFVIFDSLTFCLAFFLTHNLLPVFSILNPTYLL